MNADFEVDLRQDFLLEGGELLLRLGEQLVRLENAPGDSQLLNAVFRAFHSFKGSAGFLAIAPMVVLCHHAEDLLNEARSGHLLLVASHMDALLEALDMLNTMMAAVSSDTSIPTPTDGLLRSLLPRVAAERAAAAIDAAIDDSEFESLLDSMYGSAAPGSVEPATLPGAGSAAGEGASETLPDALHPPVTATAARPVSAAPPVRLLPVSATGSESAPARPGIGAKNTVRVETSRLDVLVNHAGELVLLSNRLTSLAAAHGSETLSTVASELDRVAEELQSAVMAIRMQPAGRLFQRFPRIVRDLARQLGKEVELILEGEETDLDRSLVEALADPLIHLLRNALDHGVEMPAQRELDGKPRKGRVCLSASQRGERIVIAIGDDGAGMDAAILRRKAVEQGVINQAQAARLTENECYELIFRPGFSTVDIVSDISGRGVGMDVVKTRVAELGGTLKVTSRLGHGSELELTVPLTLAILRVLMVQVESRLFALPLSNVEEVFELVHGQDIVLDGGRVIRHRGRVLKLADLAGWAGTAGTRGKHVVVLHIGHMRMGCLVNAVIGREDIIVQPLGPLFDGVPGIAGATVTGDDRLALVIDLAGLADSAGELLPSLQMAG